LRERPTLVTAIPTFEMFPLCADLAGGRVTGVPSLDDPAPLDALLDRVDDTTGLVVAITPHNPTGASIDTSTLLALADALPSEVTLLVDLAYAEFADEDPTVTLLDRGGVLLVRTLSKAWGLAGLRVGYVLGDADVVAKVRETGPPFPLSGPSLWLAERALALGRRVTEPYVDAVRSERARLAKALEDLGAEPFPSQANFVLARLHDARAVWSRLDRAGVRVRRFDHSPELLRFTLPGDAEAFDTLLAALGEALTEGGSDE
ncbi:MAG: histidinol-phosphate transaminase, partial [Gemmatimonadota bacterium]|nr:histidinol-phosphate transaminase [Gemmatimonadota bacterium]